MNVMSKKFTFTEQNTASYGNEVAAHCVDCGKFSGWFVRSDGYARWTSHHRCAPMINRNSAERDLVEAEPVIDQEEFVTLELAHLFAQLHDNKHLSTAVSIHTVINELHKIETRLEVDSDLVCARVATSNGDYRRWAYLTASASK